MKPRLFSPGDWICAAVAALVAMIVYAWTAAPSVTLLDSGEFIVAAQHFGVPHPTGYPVWTMLAWLFSLLPLGNVAWQLAIFSGICGALSVGVAALLIRSAARWLAPGHSTLASIAALALSLAYAFSQSAWSQATIVEVYTLHALLVGLFLLSLYAWVRRPDRLAPFYASVFLLSLAFSNHQLVLALAPLPILAVLFMRRDLFWDLLLAGAVTALIAYLAFALLANEPLVVKAAVRLGYLTLAILAIALLLKRSRLEWRLLVFVPLLVILGLLPYAYMPLASSTNPPMNWGYTRTAEGFFNSFNRSQYTGTLSELSLRLLSRALGMSTNEDPAPAPESASLGSRARPWTTFFAQRLATDFTTLGLAFFALALVWLGRAPPGGRAWIALLTIGFLLAMGAQPILEQARVDRAGWWLQMPYHTYTNLLFALVAGLGAFAGLRALAERLPLAKVAAWLLLLLPLWPLFRNADTASQRDRWFGWKYGRDMLGDLPKGSVIFGGTDPGRFVPTYMILGESTLPPHRRIDPGFDRRDLYVLTQNGLADRHYLAYVRDHYSATRPLPGNAFERWLGRDTIYPDQPLVLPTPGEWRAIREQAAAKAGGVVKSDLAASQVSHAEVARWIFERNKDRHTFYVEESFPMTWSYDHAVPDGLLYRLNPEPLAALPAEVIERDFAFWDDYIADLLADPQFARDYDAMRSFSHLRVVGGNIYRHRRLWREAEAAYEQALRLWPASPEALTALARMWSEQEREAEAIPLLEIALASDPNNAVIAEQIAVLRDRIAARRELATALAAWRAERTNLAALREALDLTRQLSGDAAIDALLREGIATLAANADFLALVVQVSEARRDWASMRDGAERLVVLWPDSPAAHYRLGRSRLAMGDKPGGLAALRRAVELGGLEFREWLLRDPIVQQAARDTPELEALGRAPSP